VAASDDGRFHQPLYRSDEDIARRSDNRIHMTRRGYFLPRASEAEELLQQLFAGYGDAAEN